MSEERLEAIDESTRTALHRQRRFLVLMCVALIAFYALGASVRPDAQYNGFVLALSRPGYVVFGLWTIWGWALLRYTQCAYESRAQVLHDLRKAVSAEDSRMVLARATRDARRQAREHLFDEADKKGVRVIGRVRAPAGIVSISPAVYSATPICTIARDGGRKYERLILTLESDDSGPDDRHYQLELSRDAVRWLRFRAWLHAAVRLPAFTDHVAPLVLAAITAVSALLF